MFDQSALEKFASGGEVLRQAVWGLTEAQLKVFPVPGTWSIHQIVAHLMQSDAVAVDRMARIIAEETPLLMDWDENAAVEKLDYHTFPLEDLLLAFELNRKMICTVLRGLSPDDFDRVGIHSKRGRVKLSQFVELYSGHLDHHLKFIHQKRQLLV